MPNERPGRFLSQRGAGYRAAYGRRKSACTARPIRFRRVRLTHHLSWLMAGTEARHTDFS
jgi:hypothetical protein